jgi:PAS domain S-box-containing protein
VKFSDNLAATSTYFKLLAESIPHLVWTADAGGYTDYFNQRWYNYTGGTPEDSIGWEWQRFIHVEDLSRCKARWRTAIETGEGYETEYRVLRHDGAFRWHIGRALPVHDKEGVIIKWFGTCTDVHNQRTLLEEREAFAAAITHDLKSPLVGTNMILDVLLSEKLGNLTGKQLDLIAQILASNKKILGLLQSLLDFYRDEKNLKNLSLEVVDLFALVSDCVGDMQMQAEQRNIKISLISQLEADSISIDALAIRRVLQNLLDNAIKFTPDDGEIKIMLAFDEKQFELIVEDQGPGIEPEILSNLFQPFTQGESGKRYSLGSGLGLYLCRQIVEAHQGRILCESKWGAGSKFIVRLPALDNPVEILSDASI